MIGQVLLSSFGFKVLWQTGRHGDATALLLLIAEITWTCNMNHCWPAFMWWQGRRLLVYAAFARRNTHWYYGKCGVNRQVKYCTCDLTQITRTWQTCWRSRNLNSGTIARNLASRHKPIELIAVTSCRCLGQGRWEQRDCPAIKSVVCRVFRSYRSLNISLSNARTQQPWVFVFSLS